MPKTFRSLISETTVADPEVTDLGESKILEELGDLDKAISFRIQELEDSMKLAKSDVEKKDKQQQLEKLKKIKNEFDTKYKEQVSQLSLQRERLSDIYREIYRTYAKYLSDSPQYSKLYLFDDFTIPAIKEDLDILKGKYLETVDATNLLQQIIAEYEKQGLQIKIYFRDDLVKYERLKNKFFDLLLYLLRQIHIIASSAKDLASEEQLKSGKFKDIVEFDDSLEADRNLVREHYQAARKQLLQSMLSGDTYMNRNSRYFNLFQQSDLSGGFWELDKESGKIKSLPSSKKEVESQRENDMDMIKKAIKEGGVWKFSIGDQVVIDSDFGFVSATVERLLPESKYVIKNDTTLKDGIEVKEEQIFDPSVNI